MVLAAALAASVVFCGVSSLLGQAPPPAPPAAPAAAAPAAPGENDMVNLSALPPNMPVQLLVEYVGERLDLKFIYDSTDLTAAGTITLTLAQNKRVKVSELYGILEDVLRAKNLVMIKAPNGEWIRIMPTGKASTFTALPPPNVQSPPSEGETIVTETMTLQHADPRDIQDALVPYISDFGFVSPMPDRHMLQITEYKSRVDELRQFIKLLDVPVKKFEKREVQLKNAKASDLQSRLQAFVAARAAKATKTVPVKQVAGNVTRIVYQVMAAAQEMQPFIDVNERTNALVMIGLPGDLDDLTEMVDLYDVPRINLQEVKFYPLQYQAADDVVAAITALGLLGPDLGTTTGTARRPATPQPMRPGLPPQPNGGGSTGTLYGTGATPKLTVMESQNTIIVSALPEEQKIVADFVKQVDQIPSEFGAIRVYPLSRRNSDDVATMLKTVFGSGGVDPRTKATLPGVEGAPTVVSLTDINAIIASASPQQQEDIARLIQTIDASQPQVLLEATLVEVTNNNGFNLGVELEHMQTGNNYAGTQLGLVNPTPPHLSLTASGGAASTLGGSLAFLDDGQVAALLQALETRTKGRTMSKPRILVNNNYKNAVLQSVDEQPVTQLDALTSNVTTVSFKQYIQAGTKLQITPMISEGNFIKLDIDLEVSTFTGVSTDPSIPPPQSSRVLTTEITAPDQRTVVIGGLVGRSFQEGVSQVPFFGDIPVLGELFKSHANTDATTTIYLFVKASILRDVTFEDMYAETRETRSVLPKDIKMLDPALSDVSAAREADRMNAVIKKREAERKAAHEAAMEAELKARSPGRGMTPPVAPVTPPAPRSDVPAPAPVVPVTPAAPRSDVPATAPGSVTE
jgi:type II secretory pathway component GspD/PulD (secretin)